MVRFVRSVDSYCVDRWTRVWEENGRSDSSVRATPGAVVDQASVLSFMVRRMVSGGPPSEGLLLSFLLCPPDLFFVHVTLVFLIFFFSFCFVFKL